MKDIIGVLLFFILAVIGWALGYGAAELIFQSFGVKGVLFITIAVIAVPICVVLIKGHKQ